MKTKIFKAFTLIELLIVIVIIGILATALIPRIQGVQEKARLATARKVMEDFRKVVFLAQSNTNKTLGEITSGYCTMCSCAMRQSGVVNFSVYNIRQMPVGSACRTDRISALRKIEQAAGMSTGSLSSMETDPWGAPYLLNENEGETVGDLCRLDRFYVAGPDGYLDGHVTGAKNDGYEIGIAPQGCPGTY